MTEGTEDMGECGEHTEKYILPIDLSQSAQRIYVNTKSEYIM